MNLYKLIRPVIFSIDPETDHHLVSFLLKLFNKNPQVIRNIVASEKNNTEVAGIKFDSPIGIAAGFDKNGQFYNSLGALGAGFVEIGSVTRRKQAGNPKKRIFRLAQDEAIINRMGLNNDGLKTVVKRLKKVAPTTKIGLSIATNHDTPEEEMVSQIIEDIKYSQNYCDYVAINMSCPNQEGIMKLQSKENISKLTWALEKYDFSVSIFCKLGHDLSEQELVNICSQLTNKVTGVILTNTSNSRENLTSKNKFEHGGLSGRTLFSKSLKLTKLIHQKFPDKKIIFSGGVFSESEAELALKNGADLVQLYTGIIYEGPFLIRKINKYLYESKVK
ncbi:quinone-dependent dihydroorotate dehydrogenase [Lactobacillus terrae]|uniref:quinone-dependent dihydroorotate dehydrogenase n=1 Tax=Lactobacillus terrae TaxID=2269374 RepID=UPI000C1B6877|nr:quinone-dependent dihydroorotate dehydrogenase [Lactobacillus terrae]